MATSHASAGTCLLYLLARVIVQREALAGVHNSVNAFLDGGVVLFLSFPWLAISNGQIAAREAIRLQQRMRESTEGMSKLLLTTSSTR